MNLWKFWFDLFKLEYFYDLDFFSDLLFVASQELGATWRQLEMSEEHTGHSMAANFAQDFLASSPTRGEVAEVETSSRSPSSCSPCPVEEETFSPVWAGGQFSGQFSKPSGRKEGDSGFISPDGATNQGANPFYGANFHPALNKESGSPLASGAETECEWEHFLQYFATLQ